MLIMESIVISNSIKSANIHFNKFKALLVDLTLAVVLFSCSVSEFAAHYVVGHLVLVSCTCKEYVYSSRMATFHITIHPLQHHDSIKYRSVCIRPSAMLGLDSGYSNAI